MAEDGARLMMERRAQLPAPLTARAVHQKDWAGLTDTDTADAAIDVVVTTEHYRPRPAKPIEPGRPTKRYESARSRREPNAVLIRHAQGTALQVVANPAG